MPNGISASHGYVLWNFECRARYPAEPALGRSRGGSAPRSISWRIGRGRPLRVTGGQRHDSTQALALVEVWTAMPLPCLITDRAYDGDAFRA